MKTALKFICGLLLCVLWAIAVLSALGVTFLIATDAIQSEGDFAMFEARIRHYTDRLVVSGDGLSIIESPHPFLETFGTLFLAIGAAVTAAWALRRMFPLPAEQSKSPAVPPTRASEAL